ncbi:DUF7336 domain-containing protein [Nocardia sp. MW-W600-9]
MSFAFILKHEYRLSNANQDEVKDIGVFATEADAQAAIDQLRGEEGFRDHPEGFVIRKYEIGKDYWAEGYDVGTDEV